jgi:hypothetical protein
MPVGESTAGAFAGAPSEDRFTWENALGAAWRVFIPLGTGRNVGVVGRETGVPIDVDVAVDADSRLVVRPALPPMFVVAEIALRVSPLRADADCKRGRAVGLIERREARSFALSFTGDGESSMMSTQPLESATDELRLCSESGGRASRAVGRSTSSDTVRVVSACAR